MSIEALSYVLNTKVGESTRKLILLGYANHAHRDGTAAWPGVETIADYADCSARTVQRHLRILVTEGFMREGDQTLVQHLRGDRRPTVYDVAMSDEQRAEWVRGDNLSPGERGDRSDTESSDGVTPVTPRGDMAVSPEPSGNRPEDEPSNPSLRSGEATRSERRKPETLLPDDFGVNEEMKSWFAEQEWARFVTHPGIETQNFMDHHRAKGSKFRDWPAAWRTWMRNAGTKYARAPQHPQVDAEHREKATSHF